MVNPNPDFWRGRRVLLTGHTGFKGSWLALWLTRLGAQVTGVALPPATTPALFERAGVARDLAHHEVDIRDVQAVRTAVQAARPEVVLHLAAQALVRPSYRAPLETWSTNVMGTAHVLDALRGDPDVRVAVVVTTDKVYRNREWAWPYREDDALGGHDPYSASKAAAELAIASYRDAFLAEQGVAVASARAGNVIGGGDWSEDRLLPDAVRAFGTGQTLQIRRPDAVRPWQHVLEPLAGYLVLAERLWEQPALAGAWNFGPATDAAATVRTVVDLARQAYGLGEVLYGDGHAGPHEAGLLALDISRARQSLGLTPRWDLARSVARSMDWYRQFAGGADARALCLADIEAYEHGPV
jgi:CDP-glucose 4,6-dehydratase